MKEFCVIVPATAANIGPGFDVLGMALDLYNEFHVTSGGEEQLSISIEGEGEQELPRNESNLFYQALAKGLSHTGEPLPSLKILQKNWVPMDRGLGSSSTAILGGFLAARALTDDRLPEKDALRMAVEMEGHADNIMAAYRGGVVINFVKDRTPMGFKIVPDENLRAALAIPEFKISTEMARTILPATYTKEDVVTNLRNISLHIVAMKTGAFELLAIAMEDRIHEPYRMSLIPGYARMKEVAMESGAHGVAISGSGPTIIALCSENAALIAEKMAAVFIEYKIPCRHLSLKVSEEGARVL